MCKCDYCGKEIDIENDQYFSTASEEEFNINYYCAQCWDYFSNEKENVENGLHVG